MPEERLFELRRRTFDTPHFRGIEFIEAEAKTIINKVPGNYLPFNYTINPYRGCSHACAYCGLGESPILMADGTIRALADLKAGDEIYGTQRVGSYRRYVTSPVLAHWETLKPAYRTVLSDGTELITSGDHRFLSNRGWKFVTGSEQGRDRRPHLTLNNELLGTGMFPVPPEHNADYKRGYLCGMIRGDGTVFSRRYSPPNRGPFEVHSFRLALVDMQGLTRSRDYMRELAVETSAPTVYQQAVGACKEVRAIRCGGRDKLAQIRRVIEWPDHPSPSWVKGFLAGAFDAEGGYNRGILRLSNIDLRFIAQFRSGLHELGFRCVLEDPKKDNGLVSVRLLGGVCEALRFFLTVDPAITRKRSIEGQAIKNRADLRVVAIEPLGFDLPMYDITTGTGDFIMNGVVSHNCFARSTHTYMDMNAGRDFETKIVVKVNAPELLKQELRSKRWKGEAIAMGTATDPYQRAEGRYRLMPQIIRTLTEYYNPFSILTKGTLILRDIDLIAKAAERADVSTALSIPTLDEDAWRKSEPGTPHPRKRIEAVAKLNEAGIPCGVMLAPILPHITDRPEQIAEAVEAAIEAGATFVSPILLHLRPVVREEYMGWLQQTYPGLVGTYEKMYAQNAYGSPADRKALTQKVRAAIAEAGGLRLKNPPPDNKRWGPKAKPTNEAQLTLL